MANTTNTSVTPQNSVVGIADFSAVTACTTRAPTAGASLAAANIVALVDLYTAPSGSDKSITNIRVKGSSSSFTAAMAAQTLTLWLWKPVTDKAFPVQELQLTSITAPSTTTPSQEISLDVDIRVPAGWALYASTSITTTAATTAFVAIATGTAMGSLT